MCKGFPPTGTTTRFDVGRQAFVVISRSNAPHIPAALTPAEAEVLRLLAGGLTARAIGQARHTSEGTVANQLRNIYKKLNVSGRAELLASMSWRELDEEPVT